MAQNTVKESETKTWVQVTSIRQGLILVEPTPLLYDTDLCIESTGVAYVTDRKHFRILIVQFWEYPTKSISNQHIENVI